MSTKHNFGEGTGREVAAGAAFRWSTGCRTCGLLGTAASGWCRAGQLPQ
ncbi:MAG TPA: hypothetical protein VG146_18305 [Verrucomicrobiae bacterium]|nr:hypothetical protein [Verrucomicrobiae bacterium]